MGVFLRFTPPSLIKVGNMIVLLKERKSEMGKITVDVADKSFLFRVPKKKSCHEDMFASTF